MERKSGQATASFTLSMSKAGFDYVSACKVVFKSDLSSYTPCSTACMLFVYKSFEP